MPQSQNRDIFISNELHKNLGAEACTAAEFLTLLQELDASRGWARLGYASLFDFCHLNLNLTRAEAYSRTRLARLAGEVPQVLSLLRSGDIKLSALRILAPILTPQNALTVFAAIRDKTTREVEDYRNTFRIHEKPAARGVVRTVYSPIEGEAHCEATAERHCEPQANANNSAPSMKKTIRMALTLDEELWEKYRRACNLSNHSSSGTDVTEMMEMLLDHYLKKHDAAAKQSKKEAQCELHNNVAKLSPRGKKKSPKEQPGRYIPKQVRRDVRLRDNNRCAYVDATTGWRCECERGLQFDHIQPFALGGASHNAQNLRLLCPAHNRLAAENIFGLEFMNQKMVAQRR